MAYQKEGNQLEEVVNGTRRKWGTMCSENTMFMFENVIMKSIATILLSKTHEGDLSIWLKTYWLIKEILDLVFLLMLIKIFSLRFLYILDVFEQFSRKTTKIHRNMYSEDSNYGWMPHRKPSTKATVEDIFHLDSIQISLVC